MRHAMEAQLPERHLKLQVQVPERGRAGRGVERGRGEVHDEGRACGSITAQLIFTCWSASLQAVLQLARTAKQHSAAQHSRQTPYHPRLPRQPSRCIAPTCGNRPAVCHSHTPSPRAFGHTPSSRQHPPIVALPNVLLHTLDKLVELAIDLVAALALPLLLLNLVGVVPGGRAGTGGSRAVGQGASAGGLVAASSRRCPG